jgi:hypothetical protein
VNPCPHHPHCINYSRWEEAGPCRCHRGRGRAWGTRTPGLAPLGPIFAWPPLLWASNDVAWWAWPSSMLDWPSSSLLPFTLPRKAYSCSCSAYFHPMFYIPDNSRVQVETRHYHMYMCVAMCVFLLFGCMLAVNIC